MISLLLHVIPVAVPVIFVLRVVSNVRKHTRGHHIGFRTVSLGDPGYKERQERFERAAVAHEHSKAVKYDRKARKAGSWKKTRKFAILAATWRHREESARKTHRASLDNRKGHGVRRAGTERGIHPK